MSKEFSLKEILRKNNANFAQPEDNSPNYLGYGAAGAGVAGVGGAAYLGQRGYRNRSRYNYGGSKNPVKEQFKSDRQALQARGREAVDDARVRGSNAVDSARNAPGNMWRGVKNDLGTVKSGYQDQMAKTGLVDNQAPRGSRLRGAGAGANKFLRTNTGKVGLGLSLLGAGAAGYGALRRNRQE